MAYGVETYTQLDRRVPKYMQGIRLAEGSRSPQQIRREAEAERSQQSHPVLGGRTRNDRSIFAGIAPRSTTPVSIEAEKKGSAIPLLVAVGALLWLAR